MHLLTQEEVPYVLLAIEANSKIVHSTYRVPLSKTGTGVGEGKPGENQAPTVIKLSLSGKIRGGFNFSHFVVQNLFCGGFQFSLVGFSFLWCVSVFCRG